MRHFNVEIARVQDFKKLMKRKSRFDFNKLDNPTWFLIQGYGVKYEGYAKHIVLSDFFSNEPLLDVLIFLNLIITDLKQQKLKSKNSA